MKRLLIVSPHFPPTNAPDMQRIRMSLPYYRQFGWDPVVLAVDAATAGAAVESDLMTTVSSDVRVVRTRAFAQRWTKFLGLGTLGFRSLLPLEAAGSRLLREENFDLVFFSNTQFVTFVLGRRWRRKFGVPYVLDVQDPWRTDYYERKGSRKPPGGWKYQFARLVAWALERRCFSRCSAIISVSPAYVTALKARYPELHDTPAEVIRFGASTADLDLARRQAPSPYLPPRRDGILEVVYTGASGPITPHATAVLFAALRRYRELSPDKAAAFRFHFFGTSYVPAGSGKPTIMPLAQEFGVGDLVTEVPHRLGHLECLQLQHAADILLLPGSSDLDYSPSKAFPYYLTGKPILALVFRGSVLEDLLQRLSCAYLVRFSETKEPTAAQDGIHRFLDAALAGFPAGTLPQRNAAEFNRKYLAEELTRQQCAVFDRAVAFRPTAAA